MKNLILILLFILGGTVHAFTGDGMPFKYISSCEIDLNGDGKSDKAILLEGLNGRELIAMIAKGKTYDTQVVSTGKENMYLNCAMGTEVKEIISAGGKGRIFKAPGAYLQLVKPESSSVAYIWEKGGYKEVWTGD